MESVNSALLLNVWGYLLFQAATFYFLPLWNAKLKIPIHLKLIYKREVAPSKGCRN